MTHWLALYIAICVLILIGIDLFAFDGQALFYLGRRGLDLIDYLKFWRT